MKEHAKALDTALATVPTTLERAQALVDYLRWQPGLQGFDNWEYTADDAWIFGPMANAMANAILSLNGGAPVSGSAARG